MSQPERIEDAGEYLPGARKDEAQPEARGASMQDTTPPVPSIEEWWPEPDWAALADKGHEPEALAYLYFVRKNIPKKPPYGFGRIDDEQWANWYREAAAVLGRMIPGIRTMQQCESIWDSYCREMGWPGSDLPAKGHPRRLAPYALGRTGGRRLISPTNFTPLAHYRATGLPHLGWPKDPGIDPEGPITVLKLTHRGTGEVTWNAVRLDSNGWEKLAEPRKTVGEAARDARQLIEEEKVKGGATKPATPKRPHVEGAIRRVGPAVRTGPIGDAEEFMQAFGFRGVQFGNWVTQAERGALLESAWDALHDLAEICRLPPRAISLKGTLGLAFGARGKKSAAAHYERDQRVINLTKLSGAGALAHEWAHGLDHYLGQAAKQRGLVIDRGGHGPYLSEVIAYVEQDLAERNPGLNAMRKVGKAMWGNGNTDYWRNACAGGSYWKSEPEMFARAFESYIHDWLSERDRSSSYLVYGVEEDRFADPAKHAFNPYPTGVLREIIGAEIELALQAWGRHLVDARGG